MNYFVCDIGGTKTRIAKTKNLENFEEPIIFETPDDVIEGMNLIVENILKLSGGEKIEAICFGIAGVLDQNHNVLLRSFHLPNWQGVAIADFFAEKISTKIFVENDTDIVGLGEAIFGAGKTFSKVVYISISTGIGGVKITDGQFEKNKFGFEPGFQILNWETGENFEELASGSATEEKFGMHPKEVAQSEHWSKIVDIIAVGLHNSIIHWSPEILVIGGSMSRDLDADILKTKINKIMKIHPDLPEIKIAELDSIGGLYGGMAFLKSNI
jgi:glucokinase